ncbi:MAG: chromosome segregation protein SMC [Lachnospiraceae bacterium]|nr:chromosome segregation protein SMC [Lachnospiraceae bacterium]
MYLKSIEIQGFKSFANKLVFEFHNGITGIVGPNGSGKSNVADAVRWVLGEQKVKQLRGSKMEDVIFAGTENRKPLGFAYVAITLDNKDHKLNVDYDEITVSRRLFRSGESEYKINGAICRLRDIQELFYDTGIGKEGYSIIGQGQIDKILSGKAEERRELFDEAAGIVKFKRRKLVAMKKLDNERANLARVSDILSELERQVKPLERQSETAKQYLKLRDALKEQDVNLFLMDMEQIRSQLEEIERKTTVATGDMAETTAAFEAIKQQYEQLEAIIEEHTRLLEETTAQKNEAQLNKEKLISQIHLLEEQIRSIRSNDEFLGGRLDAIKQQMEERTTEIESITASKTALEQEIQDEIRKEADFTSQIHLKESEIEDLESKLEEKKSDIIVLMNEKANVQTQMERFDTMLEQISMRREQLLTQSQKQAEDKEMQRREIEKLQKELDEINQMIADTKAQSDEKSAQQKKLSDQMEECTKNRQRNQMLYHQEKSRLESLKNLTERYEGYGDSIRRVMEQKDANVGIIGVVADIIKTEKKYETAIETALGGNIQNIVTDNANTAKNLIEFLKKNKYGRATFLPLSNIANRTGFNNEAVLEEQGVIGLASDIIKIKKEYEAIAKFLLGRIVVVDHIDNAIKISRKYQYSLRIVTLEGELLAPGGSMSGGAFKNNSNLLGRRREIEEIEQKLKNIKAEGEALQKEFLKLEVYVQGMNVELEKCRQLMQEQMLLQNTVKMNLQAYGDKEKDMTESLEHSRRESEMMQVQLENLRFSTDELSKQLKDKDEENTSLEKETLALAKQIEEMRVKLEEEKMQAEELRLALSTMRQKCDYLAETKNRCLTELAEAEAECRSMTESSAGASAEIGEKEKQIDELTQTVAAADAEIEKLTAQIAKLGEQKELQSKEHKEFFTKREEISDRMNVLDKEIYRLQHQKEKQEEQQENLAHYMWNEYELTYNQALPLKNPELTNHSVLKKTIRGLKDEIKGLGPVNINAIEEYKEVSERYEFLKTQHDDLVEAEKNLLGIIEELENGMRKQFNEKLADIRVEFDKVFKEMFGGGKGTIELNEDEDVLEAGISIISQPPGKKLQNMMQLSGGEKALTAIALLFAFQNLKPSPFCLLDEIEAALDGSNVVRFAQYLHKLTDNTQFIVITHRRGTMSCADRLYGITMQEKGVSTLVSVDLLEKQLDK